MKETLKKIFTFNFIIFAMLITTCLRPRAISPSTCTFSDEFIEWQKLSEEEKKTVPMPNICKSTLIDVSTPEPYYKEYKTFSFNDSAKGQYPATFDPRTTQNYLRPIKNQQNTGGCWAFSALTTLETAIIKNNGPVYNFSTRHMEYSTTRYFQDGTDANNYNRQVGTGGNGYIASNYLINGKGPVEESTMPFQNDENPINKKDLPTTKRTVDVNGYEVVSGTVGGCTASIKNVIKEHITKYGSMAANIYMTTESAYYKKENASLYYKYDKSNTFHTVNHGVTIIGWDDTYNKNYFSSTNQPQSNGAWIVQNSYGSDWAYGKAGYFYVSYEDYWICSSPSGATDVDHNATDVEEKIYAYDTLGFNGYYGYNTKTNYAANVFTLESEQELLKEVTIATKSGVVYDVYLNPVDDKLDKSKFIHLGTSVANYDGYHTFKLSSPYLLENEKFVIMIAYTYQSSDGDYPIGTQLYISQDSLFDLGNTTAGQSYVSRSMDGPWEDLSEDTTYKPYASIKASTDKIQYNFTLGPLTQNPEYPYYSGDFNLSLSFDGKTVLASATDIKIFNSNNEDVTTNFSISGQTQTNQATIVIQNTSGHTAPQGDYRIVVTFGEITKEVPFHLYSQYEIIAGDVNPGSSTMYDKDENTITIPVLAIGYQNNANLTVEIADESTSKLENATISGNTVNNNQATITIKIPKDSKFGKYTVTITGQNSNQDTVTFEIIEYVEVESITLTPIDQYLLNNHIYTLEATVNPPNATNKAVTWQTSPGTVATIKQDGTLTTRGRGKADITVTSQDNPEATAKTSIIVEDPKLKLSTSKIIGTYSKDTSQLFINNEGKITLNFTIQDIDKLTTKITDSSDSPVDYFTISGGDQLTGDSATITINHNGKAKEGVYKVTVSGGHAKTLTATYEFEVFNTSEITNISINDIRTRNNMTIDLNPVITPTNAYNKVLKYTIENDTIATIEGNTLKTHAVGSTKITVTSTDGSNVSTTFTVTVTDDLFTYTNYTQEDGYLKGITEKTDYQKFYNSLDITSGETVTIYKGTNPVTSGYIGTGMTLEHKTSSGTQKYTLIIKGDTNGDGIVGGSDVLLMQRHIVKIASLDPVAQLAADVGGNGAVGGDDALKIRRYIVKLGSL